MPFELTLIAVTALLAGLLLVGVLLSGRHAGPSSRPLAGLDSPRGMDGLQDGSVPEQDGRSPESTLRMVWWLTITIVLLGVGLTGSFTADHAPIFALGGAAVVAVIVFHELTNWTRRSRLARLVELLAAIGLIGGVLTLTGHAASPFAMLFPLVAVAAALAHGPRAGFAAAVFATMSYGLVLLVDPSLLVYTAADGLGLSAAMVTTWLLAFVAIAYAAHQRRTMDHAIALSRTDPLTGMFNRSQLFVTLEQEVSRTRRSDRGFCVLMIDLDGLKVVNDTAGHLRGDDILRALGSVILGSIRAVDSAYRYGGDEFVVLLPETDIVGAFVVAEKVRSGAEEVGFVLNGVEALTSVSIGLVSHPEDGLSAEELMTAADRAMYQAKRLGKNQISGNPRPRPALLARRSHAANDEPPAPARTEPTTASPPTARPRTPPARRGTPAGPKGDRAVAVELGPVVVDSAPEHRGESAGEEDDQMDQADPTEVRRQIAAASRSFDPDHQVRRAMDAFFSPSTGASERERPAADH